MVVVVVMMSSHMGDTGHHDNHGRRPLSLHVPLLLTRPWSACWSLWQHPPLRLLQDARSAMEALVKNYNATAQGVIGFGVGGGQALSAVASGMHAQLSSSLITTPNHLSCTLALLCV